MGVYWAAGRTTLLRPHMAQLVSIRRVGGRKGRSARAKRRPWEQPRLGLWIGADGPSDFYALLTLAALRLVRGLGVTAAASLGLAAAQLGLRAALPLDLTAALMLGLTLVRLPAGRRNPSR